VAPIAMAWWRLHVSWNFSLTKNRLEAEANIRRPRDSAIFKRVTWNLPA